MDLLSNMVIGPYFYYFTIFYNNIFNFKLLTNKIMVIDNKSIYTRIYISKNKITNNYTYYKLRLTSEATNKQYVYNTVDEDNLMDYYVFTIKIGDDYIPEGEYVYEVIPYYTFYDKVQQKNIEKNFGHVAKGLIIVKDKSVPYIIENLHDNRREIYGDENNEKNPDIIYYE